MWSIYKCLNYVDNFNRYLKLWISIREVLKGLSKCIELRKAALSLCNTALRSRTQFSMSADIYTCVIICMYYLVHCVCMIWKVFNYWYRMFNCLSAQILRSFCISLNTVNTERFVKFSLIFQLILVYEYMRCKLNTF